MPCDPVDQSKIDLVTGAPLHRVYIGGGLYDHWSDAVAAATRVLRNGEQCRVRRNEADTGWIWETI